MEYRRSRSAQRRPERWDAQRLQALRRHLGLTQQQLADELGMRQQTVSEWETGAYRPRGASARLLGMIAERAGFEYETSVPPDAEHGPSTTDEAEPSHG